MANSSNRWQIGIDARPFAGPPCGYTVYLSSIIGCLPIEEFDLSLVSNKPLLSRYTELAGLRTEVVGEKGDFRWEQSSLPRLLSKRAFDVYFVGANRGIPLRKHRTTHYVLGLLDIIPYLFWRPYLLRPLCRRASRAWVIRETVSQLVSLVRADSVLTISEQSARDIDRVFGRSATVCPIRLPHGRGIAQRAPQPHFTYIGGTDHRKKVDTLIRAFALFATRHPTHRLLLIGANYAAVEGLIAKMGLSKQVVITGFVDDDTKFRLVAESIAMVYPSLYEGYGLAIAEGFKAGTAVIAGTGGSQAEVGGEAIRAIDPLSPLDIAVAMEELLNPDTRRQWVDRGQMQLARLTNPDIKERVAHFFRTKAMTARRAEG